MTHTKTKPPTMPAFDTLAGSLTRWFLTGSIDESLCIEDISIKFDEPTNTIPAKLMKAVQMGWLQIAPKTRGLYQAGPLTRERAAEIEANGRVDLSLDVNAPAVGVETQQLVATATAQAASPAPVDVDVTVEDPIQRAVDDAMAEDKARLKLLITPPRPEAKAELKRATDVASNPAAGVGRGHSRHLPPIDAADLVIEAMPLVTRHSNQFTPRKWDAVLQRLADTPIVGAELPTIRFEPTYAGALKKAIQTWNKGRNTHRMQAQVRKSVMFVQRID